VKRVIFIVLALSSCCFNVYAQKDFRPGYVITVGGDSLNGELEFRAEILQKYSCNFRDSDGAERTFSPDELSAFRFEGDRYYVSRVFDDGHYFVEYLIKGIVSIFYIYDEKGERYFIEKDGTEFAEIPYDEGMRLVDGRRFFYRSTIHTGLLKYYMQDAPSLTERINRTEVLNYSNLYKLSNEYNKIICNGEECISFRNKIPFFYPSIEVISGYNRYLNNFIDNQWYYSTGINLMLAMPRMNERVSIKTGFSVLSERFSRAYVPILIIPVEVQYRFRAGWFEPELGIGYHIYDKKHVSTSEILYHEYWEIEYYRILSVSSYFRINDRFHLGVNFQYESAAPFFLLFAGIFNEGTVALRFNLGVKVDLY